ncbi:Phage head-tail joining protein [compost metagenome]
MANKLLVNRLDKRVGIFNPVESDDTDEYGEPLDTSIKVCDLWASIEPLQGKEFMAAMQENAEVTTRIRVRYRTSIDRTMTVKYGDQEFEILYIIHPLLAKKELQLMCKERQ